MLKTVVVMIFILGPVQVTAIKRDTLDTLTNRCLDRVDGKAIPGEEASLYKQCSPWQQRGCCTENVTKIAHEATSDLYKIDFGHCAPLSQKCHEHFVQDICFYECSPNTGPWLQDKPGGTWVKEKVIDAPLCQTDCMNWFNDCKDDFTCVENWGKDFNWTTGVATCPSNSQCQTFSDMYNGSAAKFCSKVWNYSWKMVPDDQPCLTMWFNSSNGNPNDAVALERAQDILNSGSRFGINLFIAMTVYVIFLVCFRF